VVTSVRERQGVQRLVLAVGLFAVAVTVWIWKSPSRSPPVQTSTADAHAVRQVAPAAGDKSVPTATGRNDSIPPARSIRKVSFEVQLDRSSNYETFVRAAIDAARSGDPDAQYALYRALSYCELSYRGYFELPGGPRTLDDALRIASTRPGWNAEALQLAWDRCHDLHEHGREQWGDAMDWLGRATDGGHPGAQAATALNVILRDEMRSQVAPRGPVPTQESRAHERDPQKLLLSAVQSRDPAVLWQIGQMQGLLNSAHGPSTDGAAEGMYPQLKDTFAWWLVACERGYDCSERAEWYHTLCFYAPDCRPGESAVEFMRRQAQVQNVYDLDQRIQEINERLDAGRWDELGLSVRKD
jgi:hypothetical protein